MTPNPAVPGHPVNLSFNVPFASNLAGPEPDTVVYASPGAFERWTHPKDASDTPVHHELPVHVFNVDKLRSMCKAITDGSNAQIQATVTSSKPKPVPGMQRGPLNTLVTNVCISGDSDIVYKMRARILNETPITLVSTTQRGLLTCWVGEWLTYCNSDPLPSMWTPTSLLDSMRTASWVSEQTY